MSAITGRRGGTSAFPSQPGQPFGGAPPTEDGVQLKWDPPATAGGSGLTGYRIEIRSGGDGDFAVHVAHTHNPEPFCLIEDLVPMTWYEFRCAAINATSTGPAGAISEPILTRNCEDMIGGDGGAFGLMNLEERIQSGGGGGDGRGGGGGGRRRRTQQQGGAALAQERRAHAEALAQEAKLAADIERSIASMVGVGVCVFLE